MTDWTDWWVSVGLIVVAVLILVPVIMVGRVVYGIARAHRDHRRAEARRVTVIVQDLGEFTTTNNRSWLGEVAGLPVTIKSPDQPPTMTHAMLVRTLLDDLPALLDSARAYLAAHQDMAWLEGGATKCEPFGIEPHTATSFVLELTHPTDADGIYRVEFRDGVPVDSTRED